MRHLQCIFNSVTTPLFSAAITSPALILCKTHLDIFFLYQATLNTRLLCTVLYTSALLANFGFPQIRLPLSAVFPTPSSRTLLCWDALLPAHMLGTCSASLVHRVVPYGFQRLPTPTSAPIKNFIIVKVSLVIFLQTPTLVNKNYFVRGFVYNLLSSNTVIYPFLRNVFVTAVTAHLFIL